MMGTTVALSIFILVYRPICILWKMEINICMALFPRFLLDVLPRLCLLWFWSILSCDMLSLYYFLVPEDPTMYIHSMSHYVGNMFAICVFVLYLWFYLRMLPFTNKNVYRPFLSNCIPNLKLFLQLSDAHFSTTLATGNNLVWNLY